MRLVLNKLKGFLGERPSSADFFILLGDRLLRLPIGLLLAGALARHLGPEAYGWMNSGLAVMMTGATVAQLGLDLVVVRHASQNTERASAIMGAAFIARILAGVLVVLIVCGAVFLMRGGAGEERGVLYVLSLGALMPALSVPGLWFQAKTRNRVAVLAGLGVFLVIAAVRLWMISQGVGVVALAWMVPVEFFGASAAAWYAMSRQGGRIAVRAGFSEFGYLLKEAWPLLVGALASVFYMRIDMIMLRWIAGAEAAGVYAAGTRFSEFAYAIPGLLGMSLMAGLSAATKGDGFERKVDDYFRVSAALGYLLSVPVVVLSFWLVPLVFGSEYMEAVSVAQVHIVSVFFMCLTLARGRVLVAQGFVRFTMVCALMGGACGVGLNFLLIPVWGAVGASIATVCAHAFAGLVLMLIYKPTRSLGLRMLRALIRPRLRISM